MKDLNEEMTEISVFLILFLDYSMKKSKVRDDRTFRTRRYHRLIEHFSLQFDYPVYARFPRLKNEI